MKTAYIFDIDGTISDNQERIQYLTKEPKDWDSFYSHCDEDTELPIINLVRILKHTGNTVIFVTGRPESCLDKTNEWLYDHLIQYNALYMRKNGDHREDYIVKEEIFLNHIKEDFDSFIVFEDRKQCVDMWRKHGCTCCQVAEGNY